MSNKIPKIVATLLLFIAITSVRSHVSAKVIESNSPESTGDDALFAASVGKTLSPNLLQGGVEDKGSVLRTIQLRNSTSPQLELKMLAPLLAPRQNYKSGDETLLSRQIVVEDVKRNKRHGPFDLFAERRHSEPDFLERQPELDTDTPHRKRFEGEVLTRTFDREPDLTAQKPRDDAGETIPRPLEAEATLKQRPIEPDLNKDLPQLDAAVPKRRALEIDTPLKNSFPNSEFQLRAPRPDKELVYRPNFDEGSPLKSRHRALDSIEREPEGVSDRGRARIKSHDLGDSTSRISDRNSQKKRRRGTGPKIHK